MPTLVGIFVFMDFVLFTATASAACRLASLLCRATAIALELTGRERHGSEKLTGAVVTGANYALLVGNAVIGCFNKNLSSSFDSYNREDSERNVYLSALGVKNERAAEIFLDSRGNFGIIVTYTIAGAGTVADLGAECDRFYDLYDRSRRIGHTGIDNGVAKAVAVGGKAYGTAVTAVKHDLLLKRSKTVKGLRSAYAQASFEFDVNVISDAYPVKSAVEGHLVNAYVCINKLCTSCFYVGGAS